MTQQPLKTGPMLHAGPRKPSVRVDSLQVPVRLILNKINIGQDLVLQRPEADIKIGTDPAIDRDPLHSRFSVVVSVVSRPNNTSTRAINVALS